jgi:hypothetical protein
VGKTPLFSTFKLLKQRLMGKVLLFGADWLENRRRRRAKPCGVIAALPHNRLVKKPGEGRGGV